MSFKDRPDTVECGPCVVSKMVRGRHKGTGTPKYAKLGACVHNDIIGPVYVRGYDKSRYILTFIKGSTRWTSIYVTTNKRGETILGLFKEYKSYFERKNDVQIRRLNSDNGTELVQLDCWQKLNRNEPKLSKRDVKSTYIYGKLDEEVHMSLPKGSDVEAADKVAS